MTAPEYTPAELASISTAIGRAYRACSARRPVAVDTGRTDPHVAQAICIIDGLDRHPSMYQVATVAAVWSRDEWDHLVPMLLALAVRGAATGTLTGVEDTPAWTDGAR